MVDYLKNKTGNYLHSLIRNNNYSNCVILGFLSSAVLTFFNINLCFHYLHFNVEHSKPRVGCGLGSTHRLQCPCRFYE